MFARTSVVKLAAMICNFRLGTLVFVSTPTSGIPLHQRLLQLDSCFHEARRPIKCLSRKLTMSQPNLDSTEDHLRHKGVYETVSTYVRHTSYSSTSRRTTRLNMVIRLWKTGEYHDATVTCHGKTWKVHKSILCSRSQYFKKAFDGHFAVS